MIVNKTQNQFKIRLTGLTERAQKMNELEEWKTIYKEIFNRITYFHFSHSLRFLSILSVLVMTQEIIKYTWCPRRRYRNSRQDEFLFSLYLLWNRKTISKMYTFCQYSYKNINMTYYIIRYIK